MNIDVREGVKTYYGQTLQSSDDLLTNACCAVPPPDYLKPLLAKLHIEVVSRYYGCGLVLPQKLDGCSVLDLGCGAGRDCFLISALVGEQGRVVGIDMTDEQLTVANTHIDYHRDQFGHSIANVSFQKGYIERLDECDLADNSFDAIVSNCVLNLSTDKAAVLREAYRVLKPGGEFYFSDVYADRRLPDEVRNDPELYGECLGGALYWNDFINLAKSCGFADPRLVEDAPISVDDPRLARLVGNTRFYSATYRLFKLDELEPACEDYGQAVIYRGGIEDSEQVFRLDKHHLIEAGKVFPVCGNTWFMLANTRFSEHFDLIGDFSRHYGIFEGCGTQIPYGGDGTAEGATPCC